MEKRKVFIAVHQLNLGGVQKALISALNAINYDENDVTLYIRKNRVDLLPDINKNVSRIIINQDTTRYDKRPYTLYLYALEKFLGFFNRDSSSVERKSREYINKKQTEFEVKHYFRNHEKYDVAIAYIQSYTAQFVNQYIEADRKIMFYHGSTDEHHDINASVMNNFDQIICVSQGALEAVKGFYPQFSDKMSCIENHVDAEEIIAKANEYYPDYPDDKMILCSCGRISAVKGFDLAVESAKILKDKGMDFVWYFVGDGPDRGKIEAIMAKYHLEDRIKITGLLNNPYPYVKNCDIYVQPSYEDAHPLSVIEAQILCCPVVSTATVGGKSIVKDGINGLLTEINPSALAEMIIKLANDIIMRESFVEDLKKKDNKEDYHRFCRQWSELIIWC